MKYSKQLYTFVLVLLFVTQSNLAQNYTPPSQDRVNTLLENLQECKSNLRNAENALKEIEQNPDDYTYATYKNLQTALNENKKCVDAIREELAALREDYPGWFNAPNATMSIGRDKWTSPRELQEMLNNIEQKINTLLDDFEAIEVPDH